MSEFHILVVEDDFEDWMLLKRVFEKRESRIKLTHLLDGDNVVSFLEKTETLPNLIVLDLNLPTLDGKGVLRLLKNHDVYKQIPVVVFSTSQSRQDVQQCYQLAANSYVQKPIKFDQYEKIMTVLTNYWTGIVSLPAQGV